MKFLDDGLKEPFYFKINLKSWVNKQYAQFSIIDYLVILIIKKLLLTRNKFEHNR